MTNRHLSDDELVDELEVRTSRRTNAHIEEIRYRIGQRMRMITIFSLAILTVAISGASISYYLYNAFQRDASLESEKAIAKSNSATIAATDAATTAASAANRATEAARNATIVASRVADTADKVETVLKSASTAILEMQSATDRTKKTSEIATKATKQAKQATSSILAAQQIVSKLEKEFSRVYKLRQKLRAELDLAKSYNLTMKSQIVQFEKTITKANSSLAKIISQLEKIEKKN